MEKLYETEHAFYCNEGNYFARPAEQPHGEYKSWACFLAEEGDCDFDLNLLFRWDWDEDGVYNGDPNYRNAELRLYWIGQRKGLYRWTTVEVCRADEPAVREWLERRWTHLQKLWSGISF